MPTTFNSFDRFFEAYLEAALWSSVDPETGEPLDANHTIADIAPDCAETLKAHALSFWARVWYYLDHETPKFTSDVVSQAGYDFWLTSQGHGANFGDGDWPIYGALLTKVSKCYPEEIEITFRD